MILDSGNRRAYNRYYPGYRKGKITLLERVENGHKWKYKCDCGYIGITQVSENKGLCPACSRKNAAEKNTKHGEAPDTDRKATRLYGIWLNMKQRCLNANNPNYSSYGGRGVTVCDEWSTDYLKFKEWSLKNGYSNNLTLDRIDVDGNYEPSNCRWTDWETQSNNKRNSKKYKYNGKLYSIKQLATMAELDYHLVKRRLNQGWSVEETISIQPKIGNNKTVREKK